MFTTLLESRAVHVRNTGGTATSVVLHCLLIAGAIALTLPGIRPVQDTTPAPDIIYAPMTPPPTPSTNVRSAPSTPPLPTTPSLPMTELPIVQPNTPAPASLSLDGPPIPADKITSAGIGVASAPSTSSSVAGMSSDAPVDVAYVERIPHLVENAQAPRYPEALRASGISGHVIARFVIDTLGRAEPAGMEMLEATLPLFADAVRSAIGRYRFTPGEVSGHKVRTMVQLPFTFTVK